MLTIDLTGPEANGKTLEQLLDIHSTDISREIIIMICEAIDSGVSKICIAQIKTPDYLFSYSASYTFYAETLAKNIPAMIKTEEYEICAKAQEYINKLKNQKYLVNSTN